MVMKGPLTVGLLPIMAAIYRSSRGTPSFGVTEIVFGTSINLPARSTACHSV